MLHVYAPVMRALVVIALALATATLMLVAVTTARAAIAAALIYAIIIKEGFGALARRPSLS
jgi:F0F1-type ATP synthase membrane subunit c/vacuolar-type H+-ATPase subunit K